MTNPKEVLEHIQYKKEQEAKAHREIAILLFDSLIKTARQEFCARKHCDNCLYQIKPDSIDYVDAADGKNCYARRFHEESIAILVKKEGME